MEKFKIGGQFSGVGAFDQALIRLGVDYENVYQADWDKYARQTYLHNYEEPEYYVKDVYDTPTQEITEKHGSLDIMMFSPPCQSFSLAGKRKGEDDDRGILFYNSHEFIKINKPRYFIFENVKGLLSDAGGKTFGRWIEYLGGKSVNGTANMFPSENSVPYHIYYRVLNAKNYNIPQNRERVFIIGIRDDEDNNFSWPKEEVLERRLKDVLESDVDEKYYLSEKMIKGFINKQTKGFENRFKPLKAEDANANCVTTNTGSRISDNYIKVKSATKQGYELAEIGEDSINFEHPDSKTRRGRVGLGVSQTLTTSCNQGVAVIEFNFNNNDTRKTLLKLQKEIGTKEVESWGLRILEAIRQEKVLRQELHERRVFKKEKERSKRNNEKIQQIKGSTHVASVIMRSLSKETWCRCSSQRRKSIKQLIREFNEGLQVLSHEDTSTKTYVYGKKLYKESERLWVLRKTLSEIQKVWESIDNKDKQVRTGYRIRKLTVRECFRLMDFPDTFSWPVSDSQAYKQAGNSICVGVLERILKNILCTKY